MTGDMNPDDIILGIDLGTTNSLVAVVDTGFPVIIPDAAGRRLLPSVVAWGPDGAVAQVGAEARRARVLHPHRTVASAKRWIGRRFRDVPAAEREGLAEGPEGEVAFAVGPRPATPVEAAEAILRQLATTAAAYLGHPVRKAVITVPAYFNDAQRQATRAAGEKAGLDVVRILSEPTAAALAYGADRSRRHGRIAVYDLGGGTFDLSILELGEGLFQVKATHGDTRLGGDDLDAALAGWLEGEFRAAGGRTDDPLVRARLLEAAEEAKIRLSSAGSTPVELPFLDGERHLACEVTRARLEELARPILARTRALCLRCLQDARLKPEDMDEVLLVGGQTRMPLVRALVEDIFGKAPNTSVNPDEAVALGAAIQAGILSGAMQQLVLLDVTPLSLGIETFGGLMNVLIPRNSTIPVKAGELFTNAVDGQRSMRIRVLQGERELARDNFDLGSFDLGFPPGPRGSARVGVQFEIDADGILHVLARDTAGGGERRLDLSAVVDVKDEVVERMVAESVEHAFEDMEERRWIEGAQKASRLLAAARKAVEADRGQTPPEEATAVDTALARLEAALSARVLSELQQAMKALDLATQPMAERLMQRAVERRLT